MHSQCNKQKQKIKIKIKNLGYPWQWPWLIWLWFGHIRGEEWFLCELMAACTGLVECNYAVGRALSPCPVSVHNEKCIPCQIASDHSQLALSNGNCSVWNCARNIWLRIIASACVHFFLLAWLGLHAKGPFWLSNWKLLKCNTIFKSLNFWENEQ